MTKKPWRAPRARRLNQTETESLLRGQANTLLRRLMQIWEMVDLC